VGKKEVEKAVEDSWKKIKELRDFIAVLYGRAEEICVAIDQLGDDKRSERLTVASNIAYYILSRAAKTGGEFIEAGTFFMLQWLDETLRNYSELRKIVTEEDVKREMGRKGSSPPII